MDPAQWVGRELDGRYRVEAVLGVGGMGTVLRATHAFTGTAVAIKLLRPELQLDPEIQARFLAEAKAPNAIGHPAIVQVLDAGRTADGLLYIAMELLVGRSLRSALQRRELSPELCKRIALDLLSALGHAHARGFVHRDLKPDNVFLCGRDNDVKLLDFGIAKVLDDARKTVTGALLGTPAYMAPEQLANAAGVDSRADLWAFGVIVYEMFTGRLPIPGRTPNEILAALATAEATPIRAYLPHASPEVEQFFARCLARDPRHRFGAASEVAQALAPLTVHQVVPQPSAPDATLATGHVAPGATVATGHVGPGATVATVAPIAPSVIGIPIAAPLATPTRAAPGRSSMVLWIAAALAVVLIGLGIVIAMSGTPDEVTAATDAAGPPGPRVPVTQRAEDSRARTCDERCQWLQKECGTRLATCENDCKNHPDAFDECFERSEKSCQDGATCGFEKLCGKRPAGSVGCPETARCEIKCNYDDRCICGCIAKLAPQHTLALARWNTCWTRSLETCQPGDLICIGTFCSSEGRACDFAE